MSKFNLMEMFRLEEGHEFHLSDKVMPYLFREEDLELIEVWNLEPSLTVHKTRAEPDFFYLGKDVLSYARDNPESVLKPASHFEDLKELFVEIHNTQPSNFEGMMIEDMDEFFSNIFGPKKSPQSTKPTHEEKLPMSDEVVKVLAIGEDVASIRDLSKQIFAAYHLTQEERQSLLPLVAHVEEICFGRLDEECTECQECALKGLCAEERNKIFAQIQNKLNSENQSKIHHLTLEVQMESMKSRRKNTNLASWGK